MTITVDLVTEAIRTGTGSPTTGSHGGHASLVKGVVIALIHGTTSTDHISAVDYGGTALSLLRNPADTAGEAGRAQLWGLYGPGVTIPQGTQSWSYTSGATTDDIHCVCITLLADTPFIQGASSGVVQENAANPSVTLFTGGWSGMAFGALYSGLTAIASITPGAGCTAVSSLELAGAFTSLVIRQTTGGPGDFTIGVTSATDDVAFAGIMLVEYRDTPSVVMAPHIPYSRRW